MNEIGETLADSSSASANIRDMTLDEVEQMITTAGERPYRARQILHWLYARGAESFDQSCTGCMLAAPSHSTRCAISHPRSANT